MSKTDNEFTRDDISKSFREWILSQPDLSFNRVDKNLKLLIQSALTKLDVVSREEFDAQKAVLQRTRLRLEHLERRVETLSKHIDDHGGGNIE